MAHPHTLHGATSADTALAALALPVATLTEQVASTTRFVEAVRAGGPAPVPTFAEGVTTQAVLATCAEAACTERWVTVATQ